MAKVLTKLTNKHLVFDLQLKPGSDSEIIASLIKVSFLNHHWHKNKRLCCCCEGYIKYCSASGINWIILPLPAYI